MKCVLTLVLVSLVSCTHVTKWDTFPIGIHANDEADLEVIDYYNETFGHEIFVDDEMGVPIVLVDMLEDSHCSNESCLGLTTFGNKDITNATVYVLDNLSTATYFCILAHELGHVLTGVDHLDSGLMQANAQCPTNREDTIDNLFFDYVSEIYDF